MLCDKVANKRGITAPQSAQISGLSLESQHCLRHHAQSKLLQGTVKSIATTTSRSSLHIRQGYSLSARLVQFLYVVIVSKHCIPYQYCLYPFLVQLLPGSIRSRIVVKYQFMFQWKCRARPKSTVRYMLIKLECEEYCAKKFTAGIKYFCVLL